VEKDLSLWINEIALSAPEARSEFTEEDVGRMSAVRSACFLGRHSRDPSHRGGWLSAAVPCRSHWHGFALRVFM